MLTPIMDGAIIGDGAVIEKDSKIYSGVYIPNGYQLPANTYVFDYPSTFTLVQISFNIFNENSIDVD